MANNVSTVPSSTPKLKTAKFGFTMTGITDDLVAAGVPKDHIVLAFHSPYVRPHTDHAIA